MANRYIAIARTILQQRRTPLSAKELVRDAQRLGLMPEDLYGKTQDKTMQARLSVDILLRKERSNFYRVSPGRFFLREFINDPTIEKKWQIEHRARRRSKTLQRERVLCIPYEKFPFEKLSGFKFHDDDLPFLRAENWLSVERRKAEHSQRLKQLVSYVVILRPGQVLAYRRGILNGANDELRGQRSIGFGGHICDSDADLLTAANDVPLRSAARELMEELALHKIYRDDTSLMADLELVGFVNDDSSSEGKKHLGVIIKLEKNDPKFFDVPKKGEISILDVRWISRTHLPNDYHNFEDWSKIILEHLIGSNSLGPNRRR